MHSHFVIPKRSWAIRVDISTYETISRRWKNGPIKIAAILHSDAEHVLPGDTVYVVKDSTEDNRRDPGIFIDGVITHPVTNGELTLDPSESSGGRFERNKYIRFETVNLKDSVLKRINLLTNKAGELIQLDSETSVRLEILSIKTDVNFDEHDALVCLLAYEESRILGENPESSSLLARAARESGRLVTSVSSKMANFRYLDPRSPGGLKNGAKIDREVWDKYFMAESMMINLNHLRADIAAKVVDYELEHVVEDDTEPLVFDHIPNDARDIQTFARRVRRGQSRFRKALLSIYDGRCAFTGVKEDCVLEACHIISHAQTGNNQPDNGLLLRADIHTLFDLRLATVANDGVTVRIAPKVTDPEFTRLDKTPQRRALVTPEHKAIIALRNQDIDWLS